MYSCSVTPISYKGDKILCLSCLLLSRSHFGLFWGFGGI